MKPQTMLEFVLKSNDFEAVKKYAKVLAQKPKLWMFVPCDDEGKVLEEPNVNNYHHNAIDSQLYVDDKKKYRQSLDRVFFDGFEVFGNTIYIPNLISIKLDKEDKTTDFENLDELISEFSEYLTLKKPIL